jgi:hypothetical protein
MMIWAYHNEANGCDHVQSARPVLLHGALSSFELTKDQLNNVWRLPLVFSALINKSPTSDLFIASAAVARLEASSRNKPPLGVPRHKSMTKLSLPSEQSNLPH